MATHGLLGNDLSSSRAVGTDCPDGGDKIFLLDLAPSTTMWYIPCKGLRGEYLTHQEFHSVRERFGKTQKEMAHLLGVSLKAVQSFE